MWQSYGSVRSKPNAPEPTRWMRSASCIERSNPRMRVLVCRAAALLHPVAPRPADSLPRLHVERLEAEEPPGLLQGRGEVGRPVRPEVSKRHAGRDVDPLTADVRRLDELGHAITDDLLHRLVVIDDERESAVGVEPLGPAR